MSRQSERVLRGRWMPAAALLLAVLVRLGYAADPQPPTELSAEEAALVFIRTANSLRAARGTGFLIGDGSWAVTASHVVSADLGRGKRAHDATVVVFSAWTGRPVEARVAAVDGVNDIALLRLPEPGLPALALEGFERREPVAVLEGLRDRPLRLYGFPLSWGEDTVAALARPEFNDSRLREVARRAHPEGKGETLLAVLQPCPDAQPGWSGGPLVSRDRSAVVAVFHSLYHPRAGSKEAYPAATPTAYLGDLLRQAGATTLDRFGSGRQPEGPRPAQAAERLAREFRGMAWSAAGNLRRAEEEVRGVVALDPQSGLARAELGRLLLEQRKYEEAVRELREAARLAPGSMVAHLLLGRALHLDYDPRGAQAALRTALERSPAEVEPRLVLAEVLGDNQKLEEAERILRETVARAPDHPVAQFRLAQLLGRTRRAAEALQRMGEAFEAARNDPGLTFIGLGYARELEQARRTREAETVLRQVLRTDPEGPAGYYHLASFYLRQGRFQDAQVTLNSGIALPRIPEATVEAFRALQARLAERALGNADDDASRRNKD